MGDVKHFMPPEVALEKPHGAVVDVWALATTICFLCGIYKLCAYDQIMPFIRECIEHKHDLYLSKEGILISPTISDLL